MNHTLPLFAVAALGAPASAQTLLYDLRGDSPLDLYGSALAGLGDVDGDGFDDFIAGTHDNTPPHENFARVVSGRTGLALREVHEGSTFIALGFAVGAAGDLDHDGFEDFLVGAPLDVQAGPASGSARAYSGKTGALLLSFVGDMPGDEFGGAIAGAGDVDADGTPDIVVGAYYSDLNGSTSGMARVYSGANGAVLHTWAGEHAGDVLGGAVASAGDVDLDGFADVIVSAPGDDTTGATAGSVYVFSGRDGSVLAHFFGAAAGDFFGRSVASIGDLDGDQRSEIAIGAPFNDVNGTDSGAVYVYSVTSTTPLFVAYGPRATAQLGFSIAAAGDVNGDGKPDWIAGAHLDDVGTDPEENSGSVHVYSGLDGSELYAFHGQSGERLGGAVALAGDLNRDGAPELAIGGLATTAADTRGVLRVYSSIACGPCFPVGLAYCFGHGADTPCPCGNASAPGSGEGCAHSLGHGAKLGASGVASVASDSIVLEAELLPASTTGVFIQGTTRASGGAGTLFGDGLLCVGGSIVRLSTKTATNGACAYPIAGDPSVSLRGGVNAGDVRHYQMWFRNGASFCTSAVFNLTQGLTIAWQ